MRWAIWVALCGCNAVFGLHRTEPVDARYYDSVVIPPTCPPPGTVPTFNGALHQIPAKGFTWYSPDVDHSLAMAEDAASCVSTQGCNFFEGPLDGMPDQRQVFANGNAGLTSPRLAPEGNLVLLTSGTGLLSYSQTAGSKAWQGPVKLPLPTTSPASASTPARAAVAHRTLVDYVDISEQLQELSFDGASWSLVGPSFSPSLLMVSGMEQMSLSEDGLRLVFYGMPDATGTLALLYSDRASLDTPFTVAQALSTVPDGVEYPYLTEDCGRLYFSALGTVFYLDQ